MSDQLQFKAAMVRPALRLPVVSCGTLEPNAGSSMPGPVLYSTNPFYAIDVAQRYRKNIFYAWCSEVFATGQQAGNAPSRMIAASSDPKTIYEQLLSATRSEDSHDSRISDYKKKFKRLAKAWLSSGDIDASQHDEIIGVCSRISYQIWRPYLFVIPRGPVETRLQNVPPKLRAGHGNEFVIADLRSHEFDIVELPILDGR